MHMSELARMPFLQVNTSYYCNLLCPYCINRTWRTPRPGDDTTTDPAVTDWIRTLVPTHIYLAGGEPLIHPGIEDFVSRITDAGHLVSFDTNLVLPIRRIEQYLRAWDLSRIGFINVSHHHRSGIPVEHVLRRAEILREAGLPFFVKYVCIPEDLDAIDEYQETLRSAGVGTVLSPLRGEWGGRELPQEYTPGETTAILDRLSLLTQGIQFFGGIRPNGRLCRGGVDYASYNQFNRRELRSCCHECDREIDFARTAWATGLREMRPCRQANCVGENILCLGLNGLIDETDPFDRICRGPDRPLGRDAVLGRIAELVEAGVELVHADLFERIRRTAGGTRAPARPAPSPADTRTPVALAEIEAFIAPWQTLEAVLAAYPWVRRIHAPALEIDRTLDEKGRARVAARKAAQALFGLPRKVIFEVNAECVRECHFCHVRDSFERRAKKALTREDFLAIWSELAPFTDDVEFSGGEPLLNDDVFDMIAATRRSGAFSLLLTDGQLLDEDRIDRLLRDPPTVVGIAYDGTTAREYEGFRKGGDFEGLRRNIERLVEARRRRNAPFPLIELDMLVTRQTVESVDRFWHQAREMKVDRAKIKPLLINPHASEAHRAMMIEDHLVADGRMSYHLVDGSGRLVRTRRPEHCPHQMDVAIGTSGELIPCRGLTRTPFQFGSAAERPFLDLWFRDEYVEHRRRMAGGVDPGCDHCVAGYDPALYVEKWIDDLATPYRYQQDVADLLDLRPLPGVLRWKDHVVHNAASVRKGPPLDVTSSHRQWDYAVTFPLRIPAGPSGPEMVMLSVSGWVLEGEIGVGLVGPDRSTYIHEIRKGHRPGRQSFDLFPGDLDGCRDLVVRNCADDGQRSRIVIESVTAYAYR